MDVEAMPQDAGIRELVKRLSAFAHDYPCIHCGSPVLEINSRRQVICPRCLGENPMDVKNEVVLEAANTITALQAENERLREALSAFDPQRIGSGQSVDIAALTDAQRNARAALATAQDERRE